MSTVFKGRYRVSFDLDGRLKLPEAMRAAADTPRFTVTRGLERCALLYPNDQWETLEKRMVGLEPGEKAVRDFYRIVMMWAYPADLDEHGRIAVPPQLREYAELYDQVLILGAYDHIELWDSARLEDYLNQPRTNYDDIAGLFLG